MEYSLKDGAAYKYAKWCLEPGNSQVGVYVKKQAAQWLEILEQSAGAGIADSGTMQLPAGGGRTEGGGAALTGTEQAGSANGDGRHVSGGAECYVCEKTYAKICRLLCLMRHPDLGVPLIEGLEEYEWFLITAVFCTKRADGRRLYRTAILEIARKNFKTFISAVIFIIAMLTSPAFARFFSVAPDYKLSSELRLAIRKIILVSPALRDHFKITREQITCLLNDTEYTPLANSNDRMDGKLAHMFLADEAGAMDSYPVEAMRSSQVTLRDKLGIIISTQYPNENNVFLDEVDVAKKILDGLLDQDDCFALLYEPDDALIKEWEKNDNVIFQSNPVAVKNPEMMDAIRKMRTMAVLYENKKENYLCKHNNIRWQGLGTEGYIDIEKVKRCSRKADAAFWHGRDVFLGLDLSLTNDNTAVAMVTMEKDTVYARVWGFLPAGRIEEKSIREKVDYKKLLQESCCFSAGDEVIDYGFVERFIGALEDEYGVRVLQLGYDRYNAMSSVQKLEAEGMECVEIKQHSSVLHSPTKLLKEHILRGTFRYDANRLLEINFQNARCTEDTNLNLYVNKKRSAGKVDMVAALINAMYLLEQSILFDERNFVFQVV